MLSPRPLRARRPGSIRACRGKGIRSQEVHLDPACEPCRGQFASKLVGRHRRSGNSKSIQDALQSRRWTTGASRRAWAASFRCGAAAKGRSQSQPVPHRGQASCPAARTRRWALLVRHGGLARQRGGPVYGTGGGQEDGAADSGDSGFRRRRSSRSSGRLRPVRCRSWRGPDLASGTHAVSEKTASERRLCRM